VFTLFCSRAPILLWDILDTVDTCNDSDQLFGDVKNVLLGQFGMSKCKSYFDLLRLPLGTDSLKQSILIGKLKQLLPDGVSPDNDLFLSIFLIRLLPSMWEAVGSGDHMMAAVTVRTADALWDACSGHDPLVAAATTQRSRSQTPAGGKRIDKRASSARSKSRPSSSQDFYSYNNPGKGMCK
jgi:hypothetical protein